MGKKAKPQTPQNRILTAAFPQVPPFIIVPSTHTEATTFVKNLVSQYI